MTETLVFKEVEAAYKRINDLVIHTPLLESHLLNEKLGFRLIVKPENLQKTGSFKFRGALNTIRSLTPAQRSKAY